MNRIAAVAGNNRNGASVVQLNLELHDPALIGYFEPFAEPERSARATDALKMGVIALQTVCPMLDTQIVKDQFGEMQQEFAEILDRFFAGKDGVVPKSLGEAFGEKGALSQFFHRYFDPETGRFVKLMDGQIGPSSRFSKLFDPRNKDSVFAIIESKVQQLVEAKLNEVVEQFSLDDEDSAMSRLKSIIDGGFSGLRESLGIKAARAEEAERGHVKGFDFEKDLYEVVAEMGRQFGDDTDFVRGTPGIDRCKTGDHVITLGETTGAPGMRIVVEVKDQKYQARKAHAEMQEAKKNREAVGGIFVFAEGCQPVEFGNFKRIDNDFYCTVDKAALADGSALPFLWAAYEIARVQTVAAVRKEADGKLDLDRIQQHIDGIAAWVPRLGDIFTKANTVQANGKAIANTASDIKDDIEKRVAEVMALLRLDVE